MLKFFRKSSWLIYAFHGSNFITVNNLVFLSSEKLWVPVLVLVSIFGGGGPGVVKKVKQLILG